MYQCGTYPQFHSQDLLVRVLGWRATLLHSDSAVTDRWRFVRTHLQAGDLRTLDAGCGSGAFTMYAAKLGNHALGLSFDEENNNKATRRAALLGLVNVDFRSADLRELDGLETSIGKFDQILCLECIEHIKDDQKRWGYTHDELRQMLAESGLTVVAVAFISGFVTQKLASLRLRSLAFLPAGFVWAVTFVLRPLTILDKPISALLKYPHLAVGIVATKSSDQEHVGMVTTV